MKDEYKSPGAKHSRCIQYVEYVLIDNRRLRFYLSGALNWLIETDKNYWRPIIKRSSVMRLVKQTSNKSVKLLPQFE